MVVELECFFIYKEEYMIKLKNVVKNFDKTEVIKNVSIDFENGKFYCLIGESGC